VIATEFLLAGLSTGAIVGILFGGIGAVAAGLFAFWIYRKKFRTRHTYQPLPSSDDPKP
jgi:hypothetical protein